MGWQAAWGSSRSESSPFLIQISISLSTRVTFFRRISQFIPKFHKSGGCVLVLLQPKPLLTSSRYWQTHQLSGYSTSTVGWIGAVNVSLSLLLGVQVGPLFDRYGPRWMMLSGSIAYVGGLVLLAQCAQYWQFMLCFGLLCGASSALIVTCAIAAIAHWFERKRGEANGFAFVGSSIGGIVFPLLIRPLLDRLGWAWTCRALALVVAVFVVLGNFFVRSRLPKGVRKGAINLACFRDVRFVCATVGISMFEFVLLGTLGLLPTYVVGQGYSTQTATNVIATLSAYVVFLTLLLSRSLICC